MVKLHGAVLPSLLSFPDSPSEGRLVFVNDILYVFTDVDGLLSWYPITNRTRRHIHNQPTGSTSWVITHNLDSSQLIVICYDDVGDLITPSNITYDTDDQITVTFGSLTVGDCAIFIDIAEELSAPGVTSLIEEGNSSLEVTDTGTGDIKATVDGDDVFDLTATIQRIGLLEDTNITIGQPANTVTLKGNDYVSGVFTGGGSVELNYAGTKSFETAANGVAVHDNSGSDAYINLYSDVDALLGRFFASSSLVGINNSADEAVLRGNANGAVDLYHDNVKMLGTASYGIELFDTSGTDCSVAFYSSASAKLGRIHYSSSALNMLLGSGEESGIVANLNGAVELYHDGVKSAFTNPWGLTIEDAVYPSFGFHNTTDDVTDYIYVNDSEFIISSNRDDSPVQIKANDQSSVNQLCADFYGEHRVALYHAGGKAFSTTADGIVVWDKDGNDPTIGFQNSAGSVYGYFKCGQGSNDSIYIENQRLGGDTWAFAKDSGGTARWIGIDSSVPAFMPSPSNNLSLGRSANLWKDVWATDTSINSSDSRLKTVLGDSLGLDFIDRLNTVTYKWNDGTRPHQGVIAQEVKTVMDDLGVDFAGYIDPYVTEYPGGWTPPPAPDPDPEKAVPETGESEPMLGMRYSEFIAPLIKSVQELSTLSTDQQTLITSQQAVIDDLTSRIEALEAV